MMEFASKVQSQFRKPEKKSGEGGEVILYSLLEGHLGAPKVLSKMELKTCGNHYVHGSDGVHLFRADDGSYQLIFGESKMYGDAGTSGASVKRGLRAAFESISKVVQEGFEFDTWLVDSELLKEQLDSEKLEALSAIILPSGGGSGVKTHNAFAIFVGFEIDISDVKPEDLELDEIEDELKSRAVGAIEAEHDLITKEIANRGIGNYPFHIYAVPFAKRGTGDNAPGIDKVRLELAAQLGNRKV